MRTVSCFVIDGHLRDQAAVERPSMAMFHSFEALVHGGLLGAASRAFGKRLGRALHVGLDDELSQRAARPDFDHRQRAPNPRASPSEAASATSAV